MPSKFLESLRRQREELQSTLEAITERAASEDRDLNESEHQNVQEIGQKLTPLDERIREMNAAETARYSYLDEARGVDNLASGVRPAVKAQPGSEADLRSAGQKFTESEALDIYRRGGGHGRSASVEVGPFYLTRQTQAGLITTQDMADLVTPQIMPTILEPPERPSILQVLRRANTNAEVIQYVSEDEGSESGAAAVVPEGQPKPQLTLAFTSHTVTVSTIAAWVAATRQVLEDVTQLRTYIDVRLRDAIIKKIADYVLNGDSGSGNPGLLAGAQTVTGNDMVMVVLQAIAAIQNEGYTPTAVLANGTDWFGLLGSLYGRQTALGDLVMTGSVPARIAGLPVVYTPDMAQGQIIVGDFANGAILWDRTQTRIMVADQHSDWFVRNQQVILGEARMALAIYEPKAFAVGSLSAAPASGGTSTTSGA